MICIQILNIQYVTRHSNSQYHQPKYHHSHIYILSIFVTTSGCLNFIQDSKLFLCVPRKGGGTGLMQAEAHTTEVMKLIEYV
jgi:hypothetical protein